ncbi:hypothetical protein AAKU52_002379 [Pedobacter sp. CG_S7]|uniref:DUF4099 domain-containing protein n=1 Tax=Pedobacter sp. CG_S7 TaxID=3143930 RepID=UPI00339A97B1
MNTVLENHLPVQELEKVGLMKDGQLLMDNSNATALKRGNVTDLLEIKNIRGNGYGIESLNARVSIIKEKGENKVRFDPIYKEIQDHPLLETEEKDKLVNGQQTNIKKTTSMYGTIVSHGKDHFQFDPKESSSYYIELAKEDGTSKHIWGVDLDKALAQSRHKIGDKVQLNNLGNKLVEVDAPMKNEVGEITSWEKKMVNRNTWEVVEAREFKKDKDAVIEYDPQTKQFMSYDPAKIKSPEKINGETLSAEKKRKLKEGEVVALGDGTEIQLSTSDKNGVRSNRAGLVLSILIDGGISYLLITGIKSLLDKGNQPPKATSKEKDEAYSKGYLKALVEVEKQLDRKQAQFPNDKSISAEIFLVKGEFNKASNMSASKLDEMKVVDIEDVKNDIKVHHLDENDLPDAVKERNEEKQNDEKQSTGRGR